MGGRTAGALAERLIGEGLSPATPIVCAAGLGRPEEKIVAGSLAEIVRLIEDLDPGLSVLLGIGSVFTAADVDSGCESRPSEARMRVGVGGGGR
jgi:uroporphyrin-III C-methyltransferase / precorrin-2 dehydrogenase / sirohydrochlorin ferrochelatase